MLEPMSCAGGPVADVEAESDVRSTVLVAQVEERLVEPRVGIRVGADVAHAGARDAGGQLRGVTARRGLLRIAAQVRLDVDDDRLTETGNTVVVAIPQALHQERKVLVVGIHGACIRQVRDVHLRLRTTATAAVALTQLVVGEHGDVAVAGRALGVIERELATGVPGFPAGARVDSTREVLIGEIPGDGRVGHPAIDAVVVWAGAEADPEVLGEPAGNRCGGGFGHGWAEGEGDERGEAGDTDANGQGASKGG